MPNWSSDVPTDPRGYGLPLVRTPAGRTLTAIITSDNLIGCDTHFWGGHTVPCTAPECEACASGIGFRWHAYFSAFNPTDDLHFIFETTAQAALRFAEYRAQQGTLRCCQFECYRWKQRKNGRVMVKTWRSAINPNALPAAPDLPKIMAIIWRLPVPNVQLDGVKHGANRIFANQKGNGESSDPRDYATPNP